LADTGDWRPFLQSRAILRPEIQMGVNLLNRNGVPSNLTDIQSLQNADPQDQATLLGNIAKTVGKAAIAPVLWGQDAMNSIQGRKDAAQAAVMQLLGGTPAKTPAERRLSEAQSSSLPSDDTSLEGDARLQSKQELAQRLKDGDMHGILGMLAGGRVKQQDVEKALVGSVGSREDRLSSKLEKFTLDKAQAIFNAANDNEYNAALPMMLKKMNDSVNQGKHLGAAIAFLNQLKDRMAAGRISKDMDLDPEDIPDALEQVRQLRKEKNLGPDENVEE
jgi:hypothetical protein